MLRPVPSGTDRLSARSAPPEVSPAPVAAPAQEVDRVELGGGPQAVEESSTHGLSAWQTAGLLGMGALTLIGCAGIPGFVGGPASLSHTSISRTVETRGEVQTPSAVEDWAFGSRVDKAPSVTARSVLDDVMDNYYPVPDDWMRQTFSFPGLTYKTVVPTDWTIRPAGRGFKITKDGDARSLLQVQSVESATGVGDLRSLVEARKAELKKQGFELTETQYSQPAQDFHVSLNDVKGKDGRRAEIIVNADVGDGTTNYSATITTVIYRGDQDRSVFPTVLQNTMKFIEMGGPVPVQH